MDNKKLKEMRAKIDAIDVKIINLLESRVRVVKKIGDLKKNSGKGVYYPARESQVLSHLMEHRKDFPKKSLESIYRRIFQVSRSLEERIHVSYLGPEGTYTHQAGMDIFGPECHFVPASGFRDIFESVEQERTHYGVVPIENTTEGIVTHTVDLFARYKVKVVSEYYLRIELQLLSNEKNLSDVRKVYSYRQPLNQAKRWLELNIPKAKIIETGSTAEAASIAADQKGAAAVASLAAGKIYKIPVLQSRIQDQEENFTRFLVLSRQNENGITGNDKTSLLFTVKDEPGALFSILSYFVDEKINMSKIESRPFQGRPWEYFFFVDISGHHSEKKISRAIARIRTKTLELKVLGSYPDEQRRP